MHKMNNDGTDICGAVDGLINNYSLHCISTLSRSKCSCLYHEHTLQNSNVRK